jgi:hypothetical protein
MSFRDRSEFAAVMHRKYVSQALAAYYDVAPSAVTRIDATESDGSLAIDSNGGIDCLVSTSDGPVFIAERCRTRQRFCGRLTDPDFSLRARKASGADAELSRLLGAFRTGRNLPKVYAFGIGRGSTKDACKREGLRGLALIDTVALMQQIDADELPYQSHRSDSGEVSRYYSLDDLRDADVIIDEIWGDRLITVFDNDRSLHDDFPRSNPRTSGKTVRLGDFA